jgi:hypothetical protein
MNRNLQKTGYQLPETPLSNEQCIWQIRNAPDLLMEHRHGIRLSFEDKDEVALNIIREQYRAEADWLEYYLLNKTELLPELTFTNKVAYKPFAERALAYLRLAQEVYPRADWAQAQNLYPITWMLHCEIENCENILHNSYYSVTLNPVGKVAQYELALKHCDWLNQVSQSAFKGTIQSPPIEALEAGAAYIAKKDVQFKQTHFLDYQRSTKRFYRQIKNSRLVGIITNIDGSPRVLSNGQRGKAKQSLKRGSGD